MISFANAQILGRVGSVDIKETKGKKMAVVSVAVTETYKPKEGDRVYNTHWFRTVTFNPNTAQFIQEHVSAGDSVFIECEMKASSYEAAEGKTVTTTEFHFDGLQLDKKGKKEQEEGAE